MTRTKMFILTEAAALIPLAQRILRDVREARARLARIDRQLATRESSELDNERLAARHAWSRRLHELLEEAGRLGIEISDGIRCEAWFPFEHRWVGPQGDGKIRPAYFVYSDAHETIHQWFFSGWPNDRRPVARHWWNTYRPGQRRFRIRRQAA